MTDNDLTALATPVAWNAHNVGALLDWSEREVLMPSGITRESYSTSNLLAEQGMACTNWIWHWPLIPGTNFGIEELPAALAHLAMDQGVSLMKTSELEEEYVCSIIESALALIEKCVPALFCSVRLLLRTLHIIESRGFGIDTSFSLPELPNSVFITIPQADEPDVVPRLAEAIVHEVLHLQLSLVERFRPIIRAGSMAESAYSPWRAEYRPVGGIIHGLFVFRCIEVMWSCVVDEPGSAIADFAHARKEEIRRQRRCVHLKASDSLTDFGHQIFVGTTC